MDITKFQERIEGLMNGTVQPTFLCDDVFLIALRSALEGETMLNGYLQLEDLEYDLLEIQAFILGYGMGQKLAMEDALEAIDNKEVDTNIH